MLDNLPAPAMIILLEVVIYPGSSWEQYYRLGKNLPFSGILYLNSRSALMFHAIAVIPAMTTPIIAVFAFQLAGCAYQPPAGDQTCLGYL